MGLPIKITSSWLFRYRDAILFMACAVLVFFVVRKPRELVVPSSNPLQLQQVQQIKDENNKLYAKIEQQVLEKAMVQKVNDSLAKALRIEKNNIKTVDRVVIRDSVVYVNLPSVPITNSDGTISAYSTEFHDAWTDIKATAGKMGGTISFDSRDTLTRVETVENHLFRASDHFVFMGNANPHNEIKEGASFTVKEKRPFLTIGPYIGYDPFQKKLSAGVSLQLPIIQFKK